MKFKNNIIFLALFLAGTSLAATDKGLLEGFNSLGASKTYMEAARNLNTQSKVSIIQKRTTNRFKRHEVSFENTLLSGGNPYLETKDIGLKYHYHINPRWSVGFQYSYSSNKISKEGERLIEEGFLLSKEKPFLAFIPDLDFPKTSYSGSVSWYPAYGKINLYNLGVIPFDFYLTGSYGMINLNSGSTGTYSIGSGLGFWFSQRLSTRVEASYKAYSVFTGNETRGLGLTTFGLSVGYLL